MINTYVGRKGPMQYQDIWSLRSVCHTWNFSNFPLDRRGIHPPVIVIPFCHENGSRFGEDLSLKAL